MSPRVFPFSKKPSAEKYSHTLRVHLSQAVPVATPGSRNTSLHISHDDGTGGKGKPPPTTWAPCHTNPNKGKKPLRVLRLRFFHKPSKHSAEGLTKIRARYVATPVAQPAACYGFCETFNRFEDPYKKQRRPRRGP